MQSSGAQIPRAAGVARRSALLSWAAAAVLAQLFFAVALEAQVARLRVGTSGDYAPFSSTADGGDLEGLDIEIARQLAIDLERDLDLVRFAWPSLTDQLAHGAFDLALGGVTMRPERAVVGRYTRPYAIVGAVALVRSVDADRFASPKALDQDGVRILVNAGGHLERVARRMFPHAALSPVPGNAPLGERVLAGAAEAAITDTAEARSWMRAGLTVLGPFTRDHKALLLRADDSELAERIDVWLAARERDGWLDTRRIRWLGPTGAIEETAATREAVAAMIEMRLGLMPAVAAAKRAAGLPIDDPAQELRVLNRVTRAAESHAARIVPVYRQLMELAKSVQRASGETQPGEPLQRLREAIGRIDEQILRELRRGAVGDAAGWQRALQPCLDLPGVQDAALTRLASVLADSGPAQAPKE